MPKLMTSDDLAWSAPHTPQRGRVHGAMASVPAGSMIGKLCVVTGANTGIGKEIAREFARAGARVVLACRDRDRAAVAARDIIDDTGNRDVECRLLDLAEFASVRAFAEGFEGPRAEVHVLVNNAGAMFDSREGTPTVWREHGESVHRPPSPRPTHDALPPSRRRRLRRRPRRRASRLRRLQARAKRRRRRRRARRPRRVFPILAARPRPGDVERSAKKFDTFGAYATAKQCATALTFELARRHANHPGVSVHACTPGMVNTSLGRFAGLAFHLAWPARFLLTKSPARGAEVPVASRRTRVDRHGRIFRNRL